MAAKKDSAKPEKRDGRKKYRPDAQERILERLAGGESLRTICEDADMPEKTTVLRWVVNDENGFAAKYARAREAQAEHMIDEMQAIADDGANDWMEKFGRNGESLGWQINGEAVARSKLRLEQRRWYAEKLRPKVYGAKLTVDGTLNIGDRMQRAEERLKDGDK